MGLSRHYIEQQQARQLRAIEVALAKQAGVEPRPLTLIERGVLGLKDETRAEKNERLRARLDELRAEKAAEKAEKAARKAARKARKSRDV